MLVHLGILIDSMETDKKEGRGAGYNKNRQTVNNNMNIIYRHIQNFLGVNK